MPSKRATDARREADGDEHLLDVPLVERPDEHELGDRGDERADDEADEHADEQSAPAAVADAAPDLPAEEAGEGEEGAVREVQHAHQPVDQGEAARDEEVQRTEAEAGDEQEQDGAHAASSVGRDAEVAVHEIGVEELGGGAGVDHAAAREDDDGVREGAHDLQVLLDEQHGRAVGGGLEGLRDGADDERREALRGLVDEQQAVVVHERARERHHLLLPARERAGLLLRALDELGEELRHDRPVGRSPALGEPQVLLHGEPAEDLAVLGHVGDALLHDAVREQRVDALPGEGHLAGALV